MYLPAHFAQTDLGALHRAIAEAGLATLVSGSEGALEVTHLPLLLDAAHGPHGRLVGHVARANPHWRAPAGTPGLAIFLGPDAYVSPSWYATKAETGKVVPTWNYLAIHAHGTLRWFEGRDELLEVVTRLTGRHEAARPHPWAVGDAPPDYVDAQLRAIVGVELTITRLEGKWKASQNRSEADRRGVAEGLRRDGDESMARLVEGG
jgi:transcriptional regulator